MSLADELLADLDDIDNDDLEEKLPEIKEEPMEIEEDDKNTPNFVPFTVDPSVSSIREICKLHDSKQLQTILQKIDEYIECPRKSNEMIGNVESDPEYQLVS